MFVALFGHPCEMRQLRFVDTVTVRIMSCHDCRRQHWTTRNDWLLSCFSSFACFLYSILGPFEVKIRKSTKKLYLLWLLYNMSCFCALKSMTKGWRRLLGYQCNICNINNLLVTPLLFHYKLTRGVFPYLETCCVEQPCGNEGPTEVSQVTAILAVRLRSLR